MMVSKYPMPNRFFKNMLVPAQSNFPELTMHTRSLRTSASSIKCVVRTMTRLALFALMTSHVRRLAYGSMPLVGSSRNTILGAPMNASATDSLRFCPPDSALVRQVSFSCRSTCVRQRSASASHSLLGMPLIAQTRFTCSATVKSGHRMSNCGHTPMLRRMPFSCVRRFIPYMEALPEVAWIIPHRHEMVVLLPAPAAMRVMP
mmetsp:Transcript_6132/g.22527  ORF Transcript_6132/g.22527 Transcript_6132/m.22527 type:complete len:203 (+) Transcript_6132:3496-4104(+)